MGRPAIPGALAAAADASCDLRVGHDTRARAQLDEVGDDPVERVRCGVPVALIATRHRAPCALDLLERSTASVEARAAPCTRCAGSCGLVRAACRPGGSRGPPCSVGP